MLKAYKYRIYPNKQQEEQIQKTFGCCRFVYNKTLNYRQNKYKEKYLEDRRKYSQKRRAILNGLDNDFTEEDWLYCKEYFNYSCAYCGNTNNLTQEHVIPVTKGGSYSKNNIIPACTTCNCSKQNEDINIWYKKQSFYDINKERKIYQYIQNI